MTEKLPKEIELHSDAMGRLRKAVHVMAKAGPQHRIGAATVKSVVKERPASKGRVRKVKVSVLKPILDRIFMDDKKCR